MNAPSWFRMTNSPNVGYHRHREMLVWFLLVVLMFGLLAWRVQRADHELRSWIYSSCQARNVNVARIAAALPGAHLQLVDCGGKP